MKLVVLESPLAGSGIANPAPIKVAIEYGRKCLAHSLNLGEAPFASHLLYAQPDVLDDRNSVDRRIGMEAGWEFYHTADICAVYVDLGISKGMIEGILRACSNNVPVQFRRLPGWDT